MKQRILITGGFGYLGGRIAAYLHNASFIVKLGSRTQRQSPDWLPGAETVPMDLMNPESMDAAMEGVDALIHLAAMNENECILDPAKAIRFNTLGTYHVLQSAISKGVKKFIYFSTAHVYCAPLVGHIKETTLPTPVHPYAITHHGAEDFVLAAHQQKKISGIVIRLSNGFGAPAHAEVDRWTLLVNDVCKQLVETNKIVLRSSGLQKRDFITLEDVGRAMEHTLQLSEADYADGLFNLGGETSVSIFDFTRRIADRCKIVLGFDPTIIRPEPAAGEIAHELQYDISKIRNTGFVLKNNIDHEIDKTLLLTAKYWGR